MSSSSRLILTFTVAFVIFIVAPAFLSQRFTPYPLMHTGDALDVLTPLVLLPLFWLLLRLGTPPSTREMIVFLVFAALFTEGQGMHLGANSIKHLMGVLHGTDMYTLAEFYDEVLGHYLWHIGLIGLTAQLIWRQGKQALASPPTALRVEAVCGAIYGFVFFIIVVEGGTVLIGLPFAAIVAVGGLLRRSQWRTQPIAAYFYLAHTLALILFAIWFVWQGGFPQFSELGLI